MEKGDTLDWAEVLADSSLRIDSKLKRMARECLRALIKEAECAAELCPVISEENIFLKEGNTFQVAMERINELCNPKDPNVRHFLIAEISRVAKTPPENLKREQIENLLNKMGG